MKMKKLFILTIFASHLAWGDMLPDKEKTIRMMYGEARYMNENIDDEVKILSRYAHPSFKKTIEQYKRKSGKNEMCEGVGGYGLKLVSGNGYSLNHKHEAFFYTDRADRVIAKLVFENDEEIQVWYDLKCNANKCLITDISHEEGADSVKENIQRACK